MSEMTLRKLRAWHEDKSNTKFLSNKEYNFHDDAVAFIDAHLAKPAQPVEAVDVDASLLRHLLKAVDNALSRRSSIPLHPTSLNELETASMNVHAAFLTREAAAALAHPRPTDDGYDVARHNEWLEANAAPTGDEAFIIKYEDADEPDEVFYGNGARTAAFRRYAQRSTAWSANLFQRIHCNTSRGDTAPTACACGPECMDNGHGNCRYVATTGEQAGEVIDEKLRTILASDKYRTDGDTTTMLNRLAHAILSARDLASMQKKVIENYEVQVTNLVHRGSTDDTTRELAEEGLAYFERAGDEGDKLYVQAIRAMLAAAPAPGDAS